MARVHNWQIDRDMSYWYSESRPRRQFGAVFDINKCIACQTCTLADRKSTRLNSSHIPLSRMPSSA